MFNLYVPLYRFLSLLLFATNCILSSGRQGLSGSYRAWERIIEMWFLRENTFSIWTGLSESFSVFKFGISSPFLLSIPTFCSLLYIYYIYIYLHAVLPFLVILYLRSLNTPNEVSISTIWGLDTCVFYLTDWHSLVWLVDSPVSLFSVISSDAIAVLFSQQAQHFPFLN